MKDFYPINVLLFLLFVLPTITFCDNNNSKFRHKKSDRHFKDAFRRLQDNSAEPSVEPSISLKPSIEPSISLEPSTISPSVEPSTYLPTNEPSLTPLLMTDYPTIEPTSQSLILPTFAPSTEPTCKPSYYPSFQPSTYLPTLNPSLLPSIEPSLNPSVDPTTLPTAEPTVTPSSVPTVEPSVEPSTEPSTAPTSPPSNSPSNRPTLVPTKLPSSIPTSRPSIAPATSLPTRVPTCLPTTMRPSQAPSCRPTVYPSSLPSSNPTTIVPSISPSQSPTIVPSSSPTRFPTIIPSRVPSVSPSGKPSKAPLSKSPSIRPTTFIPSICPSSDPTVEPSAFPSQEPSNEPSKEPSSNPSSSPSYRPSRKPSSSPSFLPSFIPSSFEPTLFPSADPTIEPSAYPSQEPTLSPTPFPTINPSMKPSFSPTISPSKFPTKRPSISPSRQPTKFPSCLPSSDPSRLPSLVPSYSPTSVPSGSPSSYPTCLPSAGPTSFPSLIPTPFPTTGPTAVPSFVPSLDPTFPPTLSPTSTSPTIGPTSTPSTAAPSYQPSTGPTSTPTVEPTSNPSTITPTGTPTTARPTSRPSAGPTSIPTLNPSMSPTQNPSIAPSMLPSSIIPTMAPSSFSPTVPILNSSNIEVAFEISQFFFNASVELFLTPEARLILQNTIANVTSAPVVVNIYNVSLVSNPFDAIPSTTPVLKFVMVQYQVFFTFVPSGNFTLSTGSFISKIQKSVESKYFNQVFRALCQQYLPSLGSASSTPTLKFSKPYYVTPAPSTQPISSSSSSGLSSQQTIVVAASISSVVLVLIWIILFWYSYRVTSPDGSKSSGDGFNYDIFGATETQDSVVPNPVNTDPTAEALEVGGVEVDEVIFHNPSMPLPWRKDGPNKICPVCLKNVYVMDAQVKLDGCAFHKVCARCLECQCQVSLTNFASIETDVYKVYCKAHFPDKDQKGLPPAKVGKYTVKSTVTPAAVVSAVDEATKKTQIELEARRKLIGEAQATNPVQDINYKEQQEARRLAEEAQKRNVIEVEARRIADMRSQRKAAFQKGLTLEEVIRHEEDAEIKRIAEVRQLLEKKDQEQFALKLGGDLASRRRAQVAQTNKLAVLADLKGMAADLRRNRETEGSRPSVLSEVKRLDGETLVRRLENDPIYRKLAVEADVRRLAEETISPRLDRDSRQSVGRDITRIAEEAVSRATNNGQRFGQNQADTYATMQRMAEEAVAKSLGLPQTSPQISNVQKKSLEFEIQRLAEDAIGRRLEREPSRRYSGGAEVRRMNDEANHKKMLAEIESRRAAFEADMRRMTSEFEMKRIAMEAESRRQMTEVESRRNAAEADARRVEAEARKLAAEAEIRRLNSDQEQNGGRGSSRYSDMRRMPDDAIIRKLLAEIETRQNATGLEQQRIAEERRRKKAKIRARARAKLEEERMRLDFEAEYARRIALEATNKVLSDEDALREEFEREYARHNPGTSLMPSSAASTPYRDLDTIMPVSPRQQEVFLSESPRVLEARRAEEDLFNRRQAEARRMAFPSALGYGNINVPSSSGLPPFLQTIQTPPYGSQSASLPFPSQSMPQQYPPILPSMPYQQQLSMPYSAPLSYPGQLNSSGAYQGAYSTPPQLGFGAPLGPAQEAWEIITHFDKVADTRRLNELLMSMGIMSADGLVRRHPSEVQAIAQTLKAVPRRRFLQLFGLPNF